MAPVQYEVRTPPAYWAVVVLSCVVAAGSAALIVWMLAQGHMSWIVLVFGGILTVLPAVYLGTTGEYRVRGVVRLGVGFIEVPGGPGEVLRFAVPGTVVATTRVVVRYQMLGVPMADVKRGVVLELYEGTKRRRLSTLTLVDREYTEAMLADIAAVLRGAAPRGPVAAEPRRPPADRLEQQLERELAALD
ncbi:MAG TPA: hypothetical protein VGB85_10445 [Nannocystis sp.]|jgi:hypothetical protein